MDKGGKVVREFVVERPTKSTVRFQEVEIAGEPEVTGVLYVKKWFAGQAQRLRVTIEQVE